MSPGEPAAHSRSVAIVGASRDRRKFGNKAVRAFAKAGWKVFPVNLEASHVEGLKAFRTLADVPERIDRVSIYLHPQDTLAILPTIVTLEPTDVWLNPGSADRRVVERGRELGLPLISGCSIVDIGLSPADFP